MTRKRAVPSTFSLIVTRVRFPRLIGLHASWSEINGSGWLAFVDVGSATAPIYAAHDCGIPVHVYVDETRPRNQGASLTAWELQVRSPVLLLLHSVRGRRLSAPSARG